ncbi:hypothetical protein GCM10023085_62870 [Actinomadura viridis]|uniref:CubicO group peptidase (Beta-lactamase class C family) n=1 Tax=Actinomadura viridis TaxID=58110 RepID=A0A931GN77_9ACTN|nr:serine hydrolase [Actinomadura viridis]MBG6086134.1 CubicO group peptidase (beta-lactamase class C family) [Actinomadura viridis]
MNRLPGLALTAVLGFTAACSAGAADKAGVPADPSPRAPGAPAWEKVAPSAAGLDAAELERIAARAKTGKSNCLAVLRDGKLAGEWYFGGTEATTTQNVWSATKSITSVLVGIAQDDGALRVDDSASKWIEEWKGTPAEAVTVRDLLSNDSGREWAFTTDYRRLLAAQDRTKFAIGLKQQHKPGEIWVYNNSAIQTLQRVLQKSTGRDVARFAEERLFRPLGMNRTTMTADRTGNAQTFMGVNSTCHDMARFGQMMLDKGRVRGRQVVSAAYVKAATGKPSTKLNAAYGYLWWLNRPGPVLSPRAATDLGGAGRPAATRGRLVPGAPPQLYWALGLGNQLVQVDPETRTVVVRLGKMEPRPKPPTFGPAEAAEVVTKAVTR